MRDIGTPFGDGGFYTICALTMCLAAAGCSHASAPTPVDPNQQIVPLETTGPTRIEFVSASSGPGSTIAGCGPLIEGCIGRLRMTFRLTPQSGGTVLEMRVFLHSMRNLQACLTASTGSFDVTAGQPRMIDVVFDQADRCGTPETIATMAAVVGGTIQIESRQTWSVRYVFAP